MGSRVRIRLFHILHFVTHFLFPLLKNSKSGVDDRGHRLRSGSPLKIGVTGYEFARRSAEQHIDQSHNVYNGGISTF